MFSEALRIMDRNEEELMYAEAMEKLSDTEEKLSEAEEKVSLIQKICKLAMQGQAIEEIAEQCQMSKEEVEYILNN